MGKLKSEFMSIIYDDMGSVTDKATDIVKQPQTLQEAFVHWRNDQYTKLAINNGKRIEIKEGN